MKKLVIFGSSEIATLARYYFENDSDYRVAAFTVDDDYVATKELEGLPLVGFSEAFRLYPPGDYEMHVALSYKGMNKLRQEKYEQAKAAGYTLPSYICSKSVRWPDLIVGDNCFILENQTLQPTIRIGNNVMLWSGNHIGHGSQLADHCYLASHVVVSGHCQIGSRSFIGVNATIRDFTNVGSDCFVTMGALVAGNLADGAVAVGAAGEVFEAASKQARLLKRKYF